MERITRSMKTLNAKDDKNGGSASAPPTAGDVLDPPPAIYQFPQFTSSHLPPSRLDAKDDKNGGSAYAPPMAGYGLYPPPAIYQFPQHTSSYLPPSHHVERIRRSSMKTLDAKDDKNGGSAYAPPTAGHGLYPPPAIYQFPQHTSSSRYLPPSHHVERIRRRSMKTLDAKDDKNGGSAYALPTAGDGLDLSPDMAALYQMQYAKIGEPIGNYAASESQELEWLEAEKAQQLKWLKGEISPPSLDQISYYHLHEIVIRRLLAEDFRSRYTYGSVNDGCNNSMEQKTCIWPGGTSSWQDKSSGIMWVGVHGMDSICVVTKSDYLDPTRVHGSLSLCTIHNILFRFGQTVIVEIEDLADPSSEIRDKRIEKPFGVVSVIPGAYKSRKGSAEYGETKAVEFLQEKVKSDTVFTIAETIQTAIAAFGHLFQKKFIADEIQVSVMDPNATVDVFDGTDPNVEDLNIRQINEHLAVINKPRPRSN